MHDVNNSSFDGPLKVFKEIDFSYKIMIPYSLGLGILTNDKELFYSIKECFIKK